ncbi:MAG: hypothetical protein ACOC5T_02175, partial [Elusimicrobiota bacterium]
MVTLQEAKEQSEQMKRKIQQQQPSFTQQQLRAATPLQRQRYISQFEKQKQQALQALQPQFEQIQQQLQQEEEQQQKQEMYNRAVRVISGQKRGVENLKGIPEEIIREVRKKVYSPIEEYKLKKEEYKKEAKQYAKDIKKWEEETGAKVKKLGTQIKAIEFKGKSYSPEEFTTFQQEELEKYQQELTTAREQILAPKPAPDVSDWWKKFGIGLAKTIEFTPGFGFFWPRIAPEKFYTEVMLKVPPPQEAIAYKYPELVKKAEKVSIPLPGKKLEISTPVGMIADIARGYKQLEKEARLKALEGLPYKPAVTTIAEEVWKDIKEAPKWAVSPVTELILEKVPYETRKKIIDIPREIKPKLPTKKVTYTDISTGKKIEMEPREFKPIIITPDITKKKEKPIEIIKSIPIIKAKAIEYEKEVEEKKREPGVFKFIQEKTGEYYRQAFMGLGEFYFQAKKGKFVSPWIKTSKPEYEYLPETKAIGFLGKQVGEFQFYALPKVGTALLAAPLAEAVVREVREERPLREWIKKHPVETAIGVVAITIPTIKFMKKPIVTQERWFIKPKEAIRYKMEVAKVGDVWGAQIKTVQKYKRGVYFTFEQPRYKVLMQQWGLKDTPT